MTPSKMKSVKRGAQRGAIANAARLYIEGDTLTIGEIALRLRMSVGGTRKRLAKARAAGPVTWSSLGAQA